MVQATKYSPEIVEKICEDMTNGKGLLKICDPQINPDMPSRTTVYRWLEENSEFRKRFARAREALMDFYAEQILTIAFDESGDIILDQEGTGEKAKTRAVANHAKVQRDRLKVDTLKWIASRLFPKRYGDKMELLAQTDEPTELTISWQKIERVIVNPDGSPRQPTEPEPPRQITYQPRQLPADLAEEDWTLVHELLDLIKRTIPTDSDSPPSEIMTIMREALLEHFRTAVP